MAACMNCDLILWRSSQALLGLRSSCPAVAFFIALCVLHMAPASIFAQSSEFISIDCGAAVGFTSSGSGIAWVTDEGFTSSGQNARLPAGNSETTTLQTLRYFPEAERKSCYALSPVQAGQGYIVRASFLYGNYDGLGTMPTFSLLVDATEVLSIVSDDSTYEMYLPAKSSVINVCLARSQSTTADVAGRPFISSLELRPIPAGTSYNSSAFQQGYALFSIYSYDFGSISSSTLRFPYDLLDRRWFPYIQPSTVRLETSHAIHMGSERTDFAPAVMLQTATTNLSLLTYNLTGLYRTGSYHLTMHFAEIDPNVTASGQRVFEIYLSSYNQGVDPFDPHNDIFNFTEGQFLGLETFTTSGLTMLDDFLVITMKSFPNSTFGPLICGLQLLLYSDEPLSELTVAHDLTIVNDIRDYYGIQGSSGDPCMPIQYSWTWIECITEISPPYSHRVSSLNLSRLNLQGTIFTDLKGLDELLEVNLGHNHLEGSIPNLSLLKKLETLDLQNNTLSGLIPSSLATLPRLKNLYLQNNQFQGEVPSALLEKAKIGTLTFTFDGNLDLTCNGGSCDSFMTSTSPQPLKTESPPLPSRSNASKKLVTWVLNLFVLCICHTIF